jgi:hypothetical protein
MKAFRYSVRLPFTAGPVTPEWLGSRFLATLDALTKIDSNIFPDWEVGDLPAMKGYPLAVARSRIAEIIDHNVSLDDAGHPEPESGYTAVAHTTIVARSLRMTVWADHWSVWLKAGDEMVAPDLAIVTYPLFRAALLAINAIWQQQWACVQAFRYNYTKVPVHGGTGYRLESLPMLPQDPTFPYSIFHIPWIAYLSAALATGVQLAPEIATERTADGGLLMTATKDRLDPDNSEHARRARIIAETMIAATGYQPGGKMRV